jgi:sugar/nucleoside kinase (ribokinase family)
MARFHIYGVGAALVDTEVEVTDQDLESLNIEKGHMTLVDEGRQLELLNHFSDYLVGSKRASGGSGANSIIAASYFGANNFYSCKVSDDENGDFYLKDMELAGVTCNQNDQRHQGHTGKCLVLITPDAERTMLSHLGISETLSTDELDLDAAANSEIIYLEGYLVTSESGRQAAVKLRETAESNGVKTAISLSDPGMVEFFGDGLKEMIGNKVDLLFCNEDEGKGFVSASTAEEAAEGLKQYASTFAITLGANGALVYDGNTLHKVEGHAVKAIDTNGAGDMFAGAFLYAITHGHDFKTAGELGCRAAAEVVQSFGPRLQPEKHLKILKANIA